MMRGALSDITKAVGHTPIVKLNHVSEGIESDIYVKCEYLNPGGSHKDRVALNMIRDAEAAGLKPGGTIVEATSGNTGAALAMVAAIKGYGCVFVMPDKMSQEKISTLRAYGAKVVVCGPATLIPPYIEQLGVRVSYDLDEIVGEVDVINLLRIQAERQRSAFFPSIYEYAHFFGMNGEALIRYTSSKLLFVMLSRLPASRIVNGRGAAAAVPAIAAAAATSATPPDIATRVLRM